MSNKKVTVFLVLGILVYVIYRGLNVFGIKNLNELYLNGTALENINYILQIIASIVMILGVVIAVWQYVLTSRCERTKISNDRVEKAVQLSEYYKDNILSNVSALRYVFKESGVADILGKIKPSDMVAFDSVELNDKLSPADIKELVHIMKSEKMAKIILYIDQVYNLNLDVAKYIDVLDEEEGEKKISVNKEGVLRQFMAQIVNDLLNNMEYFAMNFTHKVADETVVYQSLHQTYIEAVQLLYYDISKNNKPDGRQFYTNVVELYKVWYNKSRKKREVVAKGGRSISKGSSAKDID